MTAWVYLTIAIVLEIGGTTALKLSDGFDRPLWGYTSLALYTACFWALAPALKTLPVGVAYAIWSGVGIVAASVIGVLVFGDRLSAMQIVCISLVMVGAVGLRLGTAA